MILNGEMEQWLVEHGVERGTKYIHREDKSVINKDGTTTIYGSYMLDMDVETWRLFLEAFPIGG